ncbi:hypothetical protein BAL199_18536 [alpha proteobacterium BAL199]|jgi:hypothetical protein|nr:hypothetical protein BAL199_18536 [alpha proteobacterium BAL199]
MRAASRPIARFLQKSDQPALIGQGAAERAWRTALAAMLVARHLERPVDLLRVLEMIVVQAIEAPADEIRTALDPDNGLHAFGLLLELDNAGTSEARLVQSLGALMDGSAVQTHDGFLTALRDAMVDAGALHRIG